ncbi:hypothetical protein PTKIN_Ptkin12aG0059400 [Pterospermum kingtungense]
MVIRNGSTTRKLSIGLGDDIDATKFGIEDTRNGSLLDDLIFDSGSGSVIQSDQTPFHEHSSSPLPSQPIISELDTIEKLTQTIDKLTQSIDSIVAKEDSCWDVIKEIPNLDNRTCFKALKMLNSKARICVEEMLDAFLLIVGQNSRYCLVRKTFGRSHFTTSQCFNKILKELNTIAVDMMAKHGSIVLEKIRESTRFYPYFKDCIGAIDGTHMLAIVTGHDKSSYRNCHEIISQNVLAACNFDLEFMYVLSGWERSAHDSKVLSEALSWRNGLKVLEGIIFYLI